MTQQTNENKIMKTEEGIWYPFGTKGVFRRLYSTPKYQGGRK
jgi:hypothetical protein